MILLLDRGLNMKLTFLHNRIIEIKNIQRHRKEVQRIAKEKGYSFPFHDFWKMINVFLFGDKIATKLHRKFSGHHAHMSKLRIYNKLARKMPHL